MATSIPSYLKLSRHHVFYFRWAIPTYLHPQSKRHYVETSLRTRNLRLALQMARHLAYHAENITGCMLDMNHAEIKAALQAFFANKLEEFKKRREQASFLSKPMEDQYTRILAALEQANSQGLDARIAFDDSEAFHQRIDEIIQDRKLNIPKDTHEYDTLVREHNFAYAQYLRDMLAHNDSVKTYTLVPDKTITIQPTNLSGVPLKQAVADFIADRQRGEAWTPRTSKERTVQLALLCEILGENTDIASIDVRKVDEAMSILNALPKHRSKNPKTRGLPLKQIVAMTDVEKMNPRTVNEYVTV